MIAKTRQEPPETEQEQEQEQGAGSSCHHSQAWLPGKSPSTQGRENMRMLSSGILLFTIAIGACAQPPKSNEEATLQGKAAGQLDPSTPVMLHAQASASPRKRLAVGIAQPHDNVLRDSYYKCASSNDGSTWDMQNCIETEFKYQDARLNSAYQTLRSKLPGEEAKKLRSDERRWLSDMDISCKWDAETEGQAQRIGANECSLEKTAKRADKLEEQLRERRIRDE
jgi:uncharacterized protein YecT (DUF1311 family)